MCRLWICVALGSDIFVTWQDRMQWERISGRSAGLWRAALGLGRPFCDLWLTHSWSVGYLFKWTPAKAAFSFSSLRWESAGALYHTQCRCRGGFTSSERKSGIKGNEDTCPFFPLHTHTGSFQQLPVKLQL